MKTKILGVGWLAVGACAPAVDSGSPLPSPRAESPTDTAVHCDLQPDNQLRVDCTLQTDEAVRVQLRGIARDGTTAQTTSEGVGEHRLTLHGLLPGEPYRLQIAQPPGAWQDVGTVETGMPFPDLVFDVTEYSAHAQVEAVMVDTDCGGVAAPVVVDRQGRVRWYEDVTDVGSVDTFSLTDRGTVVMLVGRQHLLEVTPQGEMLRSWGPEELGAYVHHDVVVRGDETAVLTGQVWTDPDTGDVYMHEGVRVYAPDATVLADWKVVDSYEITDKHWEVDNFWASQMPGAKGFHLNSLDVNEAGDWLISMISASMIARVVGDPQASNFGEIVWTLDGLGLGGDFRLQEGTDFHGQHHVHRSPANGLVLFDNGYANRGSRGLELSLDHTNGEVELVSEVPLDAYCSHGGSLYALDDGHRLITCGTDQTVLEVGPKGEALWEMSLECDGSTRFLYRATPVRGTW